ncbi:DUF4265 domain-containing protein [Exilibacterium tricleocarpae]|uniref:DUF4265 domain-containing protein n=1 Tax=Exilibacterium tricleocarpae TaxID=2591008 RepID=A0A545TZF3_9GAMM|nr:DUF4265 domain-containing protein [Exilibacterium tricleocarpae]TQV82602.1 DUF4265 domain-containing protein [Exilibacterium tricleocarpae]
MQALQVIELFAGTGADGRPVVERLQVKVNDDDSCQLVKSPAFVKGLASGDTIKLVSGNQFNIVKHSGNLCIRVYCRGDIGALSDNLTPALEKLGAELDTETDRMLVYSIHVSCGFSAIEAVLNQYTGKASDSVWLYGNVYDPADGQTPLNWWVEILKPQ